MASRDGSSLLSVLDHSDPGLREPEVNVPAARYGSNESPYPGSQRQPSQIAAKPVAVLMSNNPFLRLVSQTPGYLDSSSSSSITPDNSELVVLQSPILEYQQSLRDYFPIDETPRTNYSDQDLANIARLLEAAGRKTWSIVPRIYTVLRLIGHVAAIELFLDEGLSDMEFPFNIGLLPPKMSVFHRDKFIEVQSMVFTKAMDLESPGGKRHSIHFEEEDEFPLTLGEKLGHGGYGSVYKAQSTLTGRTYALKIFRKVKGDCREVGSFMTERRVLQQINHIHCVKLDASYTDSKNFGLLITPVADCDLAAFYETVTNNEKNQKILRTFFGCLAHGLRYLHDQRIRHRDIKPENILVKGSRIILADFGISLDWKNLAQSKTMEDSAKSWVYCAPEVARCQGGGYSSDIWSLGCVFLEMFTALKGLTVQDLRGVLAAHSVQPRLYENLDAAERWTERLNERGIDAEKNVVKWVRKMMVMEPMNRIIAQWLCLTIVKFGIKAKSKEEVNMFCGICCTRAYETELSSEAVSDEGASEGDFDADMLTPATTVFATERSQRSDKLISKQEFQTPMTPSISIVTEDPRHLEFPKNQEVGPVNDDEQNETALRESTDPSAFGNIQSDRIQSGSEERDPGSNLRQRADPDQAISLHSQNARPSSAAEETIEHRGIDQSHNNNNTKEVEGRVSHDSRVKIRRELILEVTSRNTVWPYLDLRDRLPALSASSWMKPEEFLASVQSDIPFMDYLKSIDTAQLERFESASVDDLFSMIHLFLRNGLDVNDQKYESHSKDFKGYMPLMWAIRWRCAASQALKDVAKLLIGFDASISHQSKPNNHHIGDRYTAFQVSVIYGDSQMLQLLLDLGPADLIKENCEGDPPVYAAAIRGYPHIVEMLIKGKANFRAKNSQRNNALYAAARKGHLEVIKVLMAHGMDVDERDPMLVSGGWPPLHGAASNGHLEVVKYLLSKGADPTRKVVSGHLQSPVTALEVAKRLDNKEVKMVIKEAVQKWEKEKMKRRLKWIF